MFERKHTAAAIEALNTNNAHPGFMARALHEIDGALDALEARAEAAGKALAEALEKLAGHAPATQNALQTLPATDAAPSSTEPAQAAAVPVPAAVAPAPAVPQPAAA